MARCWHLSIYSLKFALFRSYERADFASVQKMKNSLLIAAIVGCSFVAVCRADDRPEATIPLQLQQDRPLVSVEVNHVPLVLLLDLGAYDTIRLNKTDAVKAGVQASNSIQKFSAFDGKQGHAAGAHFNVVTAGDANFGEVAGSVKDGEDISYLGAGLLGKKLMVFDYAHNQVRLYKSGDLQALQRECGDERFPVDVRKGVFQTYLRTDGKTLTAAFDTGANYSVIRPSVFNLPGGEYVPGSSPQIRELHNLRLNNAEVKGLNAVLIEFKAPSVDIVLGTNFFENYRVCLDGPAHIGAIR